MCGIAGIFDLREQREPDRELLAAMKPGMAEFQAASATALGMLKDRKAIPLLTKVAKRRANRADVVRAMEREYPPLLRDAGIGGTVRVYFFIDENGSCTNQWFQLFNPT